MERSGNGDHISAGQCVYTTSNTTLGTITDNGSGNAVLDITAKIPRTGGCSLRSPFLRVRNGRRDSEGLAGRRREDGEAGLKGASVAKPRK